ncbi:AzlD domain-containing protein [Baekduia soli]|nr:AzlD domain-containing protein [Baekduia soli]
MTALGAIIAASAACYGLKLAGYLVPAAWLSRASVAHVLTLLPACLLAALVVVQTFTSGAALALDARAAGLAAAAAALLLRAPFLVVVIVAAATAALLRAVA